VRKQGWSWYATGPVHGIQLASGRLVVPCNHVVGAHGAGGWHDRAHIVYSDDGGDTWALGGLGDFGTCESTVVQLTNGSLYLNSRNCAHKKVCRNLCVSFSNYPPIIYYWTVPLILDHSYLVEKSTGSKIADIKVSGF
jgi:sialidase-1